MYQFLRFIFQCLLNLFFREIVYRNKHKIPKHLPTIFVIAPHHNQFVDPLMVITASDRPIGFLAAAKSMRRLVVGFFSRALKAIPVERGQDLVFKGSGQVMFNSETGLTGFNTKFTTELEPRFTLTIESITVEIVEIISDTKLVIKEVELEFSALIDRKISYKVTPYINQHDMFKSVIERLKTNGCVGIFPEGGSHDRSEFLPLKAGVSIMALAAMSENPNLNVQIVPVGLSYFHADRFRSRAVVEFGEPLTVSSDLVELYSRGGSEKREACSTLLETIKNALQAITVMAPDFDSLMLMQACRRLYKPADKKLTTAETLELTRRFLNGYLLFKNEPQVVALANEVRAYNTMLRNYGIRDHQVKNTGKSRLHAFGLLLWREFILLLFTITLIPGAILNFPAWIVITWIASKKQKEALAGSSVKISAKDVVATWKLMVSLVFLPILYLVEAIVLTLCLVYFTTVTTIVSPWALFFSFYAIIPVISIFSIYAGERAIDIIKSIRPLLVSLFQSQESIMLLESSRMNLEKKLAELVDVLGPKMYHDFEKTRMIKISDEDVVESGDESQTEGYFYDARIEKRRGKKNQED